MFIHPRSLLSANAVTTLDELWRMNTASSKFHAFDEWTATWVAMHQTYIEVAHLPNEWVNSTISMNCRSDELAPHPWRHLLLQVEEDDGYKYEHAMLRSTLPSKCWSYPDHMHVQGSKGERIFLNWQKTPGPSTLKAQLTGIKYAQQETRSSQARLSPVTLSQLTQDVTSGWWIMWSWQMNLKQWRSI